MPTRIEEVGLLLKGYGTARTGSQLGTLRAANKARSVLMSVFRTLLLFGLSFIILYPLLYMVSVTFREPMDLLDSSVVWIPRHPTLANLPPVLKLLDYFRSLSVTLMLAIGCTAFQCFTCSLTGYGFARFRFRFKGPLFFLALFSLIVPPQAITMPLYIGAVNFTDLTRKIGFLPGLFPDGVTLIDTPFPLVASALFGVGLRAGLFIFIFRQFYRNLPVELEDAAYVDGCGPIMAYWRVMFVNAGPVLLVAFLFSFVWYWNDTLNVSLFFTSARPLSVVVATFREILNMYRSPEGVANSQTVNAAWTQAACLLYIAPILAVYVFLQKYFTQSIVRSGIVG